MGLSGSLHYTHSGGVVFGVAKGLLGCGFGASGSFLRGQMWAR